MSDLFCFIPAKIGSQRLPKKNIRLFQGKEMLGYVVEAAQRSKLFGDQIIVSTESAEVRQVAENFGALCPYERRAELAKDPYGVKDVLLDFFEQLPEYKKYKDVCLLLPTSPLNDAAEILAAYKTYKSSGQKGLASVTELDYNAHRALLRGSDGVLKPIFKDLYLKNSKDLPKTYRINGAIMFLNIDHFLSAKTYLFDGLASHVMPFEKSIDVDTENDARLVEYLMSPS
jgi:CMP-N-acetylneuraminic acid synthetase